MSVVGEVLLDPLVDLAERHSAVGLAHGQADQGGVGEGRLDGRIARVVVRRAEQAVLLQQLRHVRPLVHQQLPLRVRRRLRARRRRPRLGRLLARGGHLHRRVAADLQQSAVQFRRGRGRGQSGRCRGRLRVRWQADGDVVQPGQAGEVIVVVAVAHVEAVRGRGGRPHCISCVSECASGGAEWLAFRPRWHWRAAARFTSAGAGPAAGLGGRFL